MLSKTAYVMLLTKRRIIKKGIKYSKWQKTGATVLITGETGVGKEIVTKEIHKNSLRN